MNFEDHFLHDQRLIFTATLTAGRDQIQAEWLKSKQTLQRIWPRKGRRVLSIIHEGVGEIGNEDANDFVAEINSIGKHTPIDIIIHTPGGGATASDRIAEALVDRSETTAFIPLYAWSGGTEIALATQLICMGNGATLSPTDIQLGDTGVSARTVIQLAKQLGNQASESLQIAAIEAEKFLRDRTQRACTLINRRHKGGWWNRDRCALARTLTSGDLSHSHRIGYREARHLGIRVLRKMPREVEQFVNKRREQLHLLHELDSQITFVQVNAPSKSNEIAAA